MSDNEVRDKVFDIFEEAIKDCLANNSNDLKQTVEDTIDNNKSQLIQAAKNITGKIVTEAISDSASSNGATPISKMTFTSGDMLTHARSLFEYHAGQRLNSIRYFLIAFSLFATAYFTVLSNDINTLTELLSIIALCIMSIVVSFIFLGLDVRNSEMVHVDEIALEELESHAAENHKSAPSTKKNKITGTTKAFQITKNWDDGILNEYSNSRFLHCITQYSALVNVFFFIVILSSGLAIFPPLVEYYNNKNADSLSWSFDLVVSGNTADRGSNSANEMVIHETVAGLSGMPEVIDGDTLIVASKTVRLFGIDAPELGQHCAIGARTYDCGAVSRTALLDLTAGTPVTCELMKGANGTSNDEGKPGRCFADGYDLSEGMAYTGWALAERDVTDRYVSFETGAHKAGRGLWKGDFVPPWAWRDGQRLQREAEAQ